jgi:hypothetical protein
MLNVEEYSNISFSKFQYVWYHLHIPLAPIKDSSIQLTLCSG